MLKRTVLFDRHVALKARMAPFGGYEMPIQYEGIILEHQATRSGVTLFDTCHMGEFLVSGPTALSDLDHLVTCDVAGLSVGQCRYGLLCNEAGGVIDDLLVYRRADAEFMLVVNGATQAKDLAWIRAHLSEGTELVDVSSITAKIDVQGPQSAAIVARLMDSNMEGLRFYRFMENRYRDHPVLLSRTGYTGELGFEVYLDNERAADFWNDCLARGAAPAGLGARDTLRLEMGMPLYGHELNEDRNAGESGFARSICLDKAFLGREQVADPTRSASLLVGIALEGRRAAREGDAIQTLSGDPLGIVTSGSFAPSLGKAIALGYITRSHSAVGTPVQVQTARQALEGTIVELPFYKEGAARKAIRDFCKQ